jgi:amino acid transporter
MTAASRCAWAFSRDGGIPGSQLWKVVNPRYGVPLNSLILSTVVCALLGLIYLGSSAAFNAFTGGECFVQDMLAVANVLVATICLGCSYAFPVLCSLIRRRKMVKDAPFSLGKFGYVIVSLASTPSTVEDATLTGKNILTVVWITFSIVLFCMRTSVLWFVCLSDVRSDRYTCYCADNELRQCGVRWLLRYRRAMVRRQREEVLQRPDGQRRPAHISV